MSSIMIVEDHAILGKALVHLLTEKADQNVVGVMGSAEEALEQLPNVDVDLVLVDVSLPKMNGIQLVSIIHQQFPSLPCLVISGHLIPLYVQRAMQAGARGYVLKDDVMGILEAIPCVLKGEIYISKALREQES